VRTLPTKRKKVKGGESLKQVTIEACKGCTLPLSVWLMGKNNAEGSAGKRRRGGKRLRGEEKKKNFCREISSRRRAWVLDRG